MKIAHIIVPVKVEPASDLFVAQPVTFETMRRAKAFADDTVDVELFTTQYPEDHPILPHGFTVLPDLPRSVLDVGSFEYQRKLPILADILQALYDATDAEYLIYTNVDIALLPHFYVSAAALLNTHDSLVINRRTIGGHYAGVSEIPLMYTDIGMKHPGRDCFIFRRDMVPKMQLGTACIGARHIAFVMYLNLLAHSTSLLELTDAHCTFHIGDDRAWKADRNQPYTLHNQAQATALLRQMQADGIAFDASTPVGEFLVGKLNRNPNNRWIRAIVEGDKPVGFLSRFRLQRSSCILKVIKPLVRRAKKFLRTAAK